MTAHLPRHRRHLHQQPATVTITVTPHAPGSTMAGGVGFQGPGAAASNNYGAVSGNAGSFRAGAGTPDNFDPTFNGPGLWARASTPPASTAVAHARQLLRPQRHGTDPALSGGQMIDPYYTPASTRASRLQRNLRSVWVWHLWVWPLWLWPALGLELLYNGSFSTHSSTAARPGAMKAPATVMGFLPVRPSPPISRPAHPIRGFRQWQWSEEGE